MTNPSLDAIRHHLQRGGQVWMHLKRNPNGFNVGPHEIKGVDGDQFIVAVLEGWEDRVPFGRYKIPASTREIERIELEPIVGLPVDTVGQAIDRTEYREWLEANGIELPNLGVNWPAGDAWGAAENIIHLRRQWQELKQKDAEARNTPNPLPPFFGRSPVTGVAEACARARDIQRAIEIMYRNEKNDG